ncbi:hypothetical protein [Salinigranum halophilum]|uniref:hypothetical protein n=1 Tax=Salinigranum halophilum TaxID=2565931 RepID=UPI0010A7A909|nr:hypothetical protein [Salinigranum halophilum]
MFERLGLVRPDAEVEIEPLSRPWLVNQELEREVCIDERDAPFEPERELTSTPGPIQSVEGFDDVSRCDLCTCWCDLDERPRCRFRNGLDLFFLRRIGLVVRHTHVRF